ncbi:cell division protein ZapA [Clostridium homopropionicum DSM 5847]|uniref:Cell division protein ZapA n=1 Tax=Clostridium homopropionicum DSM 5847 TaxID=1121318 RepID=A0A0L6ZB95_9CLOT|nr:cell division protein ZapA [Clostridium homopropionicum]KOA20236.1 cell division protein ZapA [Clostridium homopropionicum DSM 5847]SFG58067.1 cell division protein ZapA [Clostridium homopropionicum]
MNVVTVKINGSEYNLKGEEREEYLHRVASYVDKRIIDMLKKNSRLNVSDASVLAALNIVDEKFKADNIIETLKKEAEQASNAEKALQTQVNDLKRHINNLEEYNIELQNKLESTKSGEYIKEIEDENKALREELELLKETSKKYLKEKNDLKAENKELKFQVQSSKYKIMDLQNRLIENQIDLAKIKKKDNPLLNIK